MCQHYIIVVVVVVVVVVVPATVTVRDHIRWGTYRRHLANAIERSVVSGDAGCHYPLLLQPVIINYQLSAH